MKLKHVAIITAALALISSVVNGSAYMFTLGLTIVVLEIVHQHCSSIEQDRSTIGGEPTRAKTIPIQHATRKGSLVSGQRRYRREECRRGASRTILPVNG